MLNNKFGCIIKICCVDCGEENVSFHHSITIPIYSVCNKTSDDESLSKEISMCYNKECGICGVDSIRLISFDIHNYLAIIPKENDNVIKIYNIKTYLNVCEKKLILAGVIKYLPSKIPNCQGHYIAYCRSFTGKWQKKDNNTSKILNVKKNVKIKILLLFYVCITN